MNESLFHTYQKILRITALRHQAGWQAALPATLVVRAGDSPIVHTAHCSDKKMGRKKG